MTTEEIESVRERVRVFAFQYCLAIGYAQKKQDGSHEREVASGFLYEHAGTIALVTCQHVLEGPKGINTWHRKGTLNILGLYYPRGPRSVVPTSFEPWSKVETWDDIDLACVVLEAETVSEMLGYGVAVLPNDASLIRPECKSFLQFVCGYLARGTLIKESDKFETLEDGVQYEHVYRSIGRLNFQTPIVGLPNDRTLPIIECETVNDDSSSFGGLSGGIVLEFVDGTPQLGWAGIQSSQTVIDRSPGGDIERLGEKRALSIQYINSAVACERLNEYLKSVPPNT